MKQGSKSATARTKKINQKPVPSWGEQSRKVLPAMLDKKTKSTDNLDVTKSTSKISSASRRDSKSKADSKRNSSLEETVVKYNVDEMSSIELHESLSRLKEHPVQPFSFLNNILGDESADSQVIAERRRPTEIDTKLEALTQRIKLNKYLLKSTNDRVKEINSLVDRHVIITSRDVEKQSEKAPDISDASTTE